MTITEQQKELINAQAEVIKANSELLAEMGYVELTPDQEAVLALYLTDFSALFERVESLIQDIFR